MTIKTESGLKSRVDYMTREAGQVGCHECKALSSARLSANQVKAHEEISKTGGTIVGKGKPNFPGTKFSPTDVNVIVGPDF